MAHEIYGNRFLDRKAAWHRIGLQNVTEKLGVLEALRKIKGDFDVTMSPLYFTTPDGKHQQSDYCQILRYPMDDETFKAQRDSESTLFGARARAKERGMVEALTMAGIKPQNAPTGLN